MPNRPHPNPLPKGEGTHPPSGLVYTAFYQAAPEASAAPPQQHFHVTGRTMHARVQMTEQRQGELAELTIEGNVCCRETQTLQPDERPLTITGDRLHVTDASGPRTVATVTGQPARCEGRGWTVISANVNLSYGENRVWIEGPGKMILPQDAAVAGPMVPSGRTSGTTGPVTITWQGGMHFDGRSANFTRSVVASTPSRWLQCEALEAQLDRPIRFKDPHLQNQPQPEAEKLFCRGGVWMENRDGDSAGWLTGLDRMHAVELNLDAKTGALAAAGPGWINSVRQGRNQPLQFSLAGTAAPPSAATADPNQRYCLNVQFQGSIAGNLSEGQRHLAFYHDVRGVYAPVASWETTLTPDAPEGLPPEGISLECDRLAVDQRADPQGGPDAIELIAEGNTVVQDKYFTARALRITYAKAKELLILEGDGRTDAWLGYQKQVGGETSEVAARQIWYWKDTGRINIIDARSAEVNQFAPPGK
ncbi:MAG: hypothetical protein JXB10_19265 [Pirellulales bacterium]|nr:hypothetical protein [Pirellulales bacterium]